ncbi:MAG: metallophosphoesterase [bacterium]
MKIGFISDIHEDIHSLENALRVLTIHNCDRIVCLGDIVGFTIPFYRYIETRNAEECIRMVKENCSSVVIGNHDLYAIKKIPFYSAGFNYGSNWYELDYDVRAKKSRNKIWLYEDNELTSKLGESAKEYLSKLNEIEVMEIDEKKFFLSHFCYPDFSGSSIHFPGEAFHLKKHFEFISTRDCKLSFSGHGHPEGALVVNDEKISSVGFGHHKLSDDFRWIVTPCVARTTRENGVMIFDTANFLIDVISLKEMHK